MSDSGQFRDEHERQLDAIIARYYRAVEEGLPPDQDKFAGQHPEFERDLREFFADLGNLQGAVPRAEVNLALANTLAMPAPQLNKLTDGSVVRYFGEYEILGELGAGGMGVVYKARQTKLGRIVALKMIRSGELANTQDVQRFQAETKAAARLTHAGIVAVHEVGIHNGQHFYTMDFVEGGSLSRLHRDEPVPARRAAEIVKQLAEAIHYSHGLGIVHRDLKPANILLANDGSPKITDFGLAKRMWVDEDSLDAPMTETGQILGTAGYMSPEQAAGKTRLVGPPADIYSLGAVLYALLTSRAPFMGESQADTIQQVMHKEPVSPRVLNPSITRDLETICLKCLEKEPHKRYGTAQLLADDLARFLEGRSVLARPINRPARAGRWCRRNPTLAALGLVVLLVAVVSPLVAIQMHRLAADREQARKVATDKAAELTDALARERKAISKLAAALDAERQASEAARESARNERRRRYVSDMNLIASHWATGNLTATRTLLREYEPQLGEEDLREFVWRYWSNASQAHDRVKRTPTPVLNPCSTAVSPDGRRIAFANSSRRMRFLPTSPIHVRRYDTPVGTTDEFRLPLSESGSTIIDLAFILDSNALAVYQRDEITLWNLAGSVATKETLPLENTPENSLGEGTFSENGRFVVIPRVSRSAAKPKKGATICEAWDLVERKRVGQAAMAPLLRDIRISNDGVYLADSSGLVWNLKEGKIDYSLPKNLDMLSVSPLPDGQRLVTQGTQGRLSLWDRHGRERVLADTCGPYAVSTQRQEVCWSTSAGVFVQSLDSEGHKRKLEQRSPLGLIYAPDGKTILAIEGTSVAYWPLDTEETNEHASLLKFKGMANATSPLGTYFATGHQMWETATGRQLGQYSPHDSVPNAPIADATVRGVSVTEKGEVVTCSFLGTVVIWNGLSGEYVEALKQSDEATTTAKAIPQALMNVAASSDANLIAASRIDGQIVIWNRKNKTVRQLNGKTTVAMPAPEFSPDGQLLGVYGTGGFTVWNTATLQVVPERKSWGNCFRYRDQWVLPERLSNGETQLLNYTTGQPVHRLGSLTDFSSIAATADGKNLATISMNGLLTIWDARLPAPLSTFQAQSGKPYFLEGGSVLALVQSDGNIRRWLGPSPAPK